MREFAIVRILSNIWNTLIYARRRKMIASRSQDLGVYLCSSIKPPVVSDRASFALFYRSRFIWNVAQVIFFGCLAIWTVKNYLAVIKSL